MQSAAITKSIDRFIDPADTMVKIQKLDLSMMIIEDDNKDDQNLENHKINE